MRNRERIATLVHYLGRIGADVYLGPPPVEADDVVRSDTLAADDDLF